MEIIIPAIFAFAGIVVGKIAEVMIAKLNAKNKRDDQMASCKKEHAEKIEKVREEFNDKLDEQDAKIDQISETLIEVKGMIQNLSSLFELLSNRVEKHNNVIERTYKCEQRLEDIAKDVDFLKTQKKN